MPGTFTQNPIKRIADKTCRTFLYIFKKNAKLYLNNVAKRGALDEIFWAFAIGQAVCYLGGALQSGTYNFELSTIISLIVGVIAIIAVRFISPKKAEA